ncbi:MAG: phage antirepressor KilAC domain-containing protein [Prevotellaceae bacterium]|jgi:anti-repressor protein|nr:phage antirepressor KilAC domain-containing protein [Prevotellaceae bacterium]
MENNNETKGLQAFCYGGHKVRVIQIDREPWWVLKDVCRVLGISNPTHVASRLDEDERATFNVGRQGDTNFVNESGLYNVIMRSDKPHAKPFMRWVTHEVLPQIRKYGAYVTSSKIDEILTDPDAWIKLLTTVKEERLARERLQIQVEHDRPKIIFADAVSVSETGILIGELAKILKGNGVEIGANRLFERLRQDGFLIKRSGADYNTPTQMAMELGLFKIQETAITHSDGRVTISKTAKVTGKGQTYFVNYFLNNGKNNLRNHEELETEITEGNSNYVEDNDDI